MSRMALASIVLALTAARALACPPQVHVRALGGVWERAAAVLRDELGDRDDVDRCVELEVFGGAGGVEVTAWFPDGRRATRALASPRALRATVLALVLVTAPVVEAAPIAWRVQPPATPVPSEPTVAAAVTAVPPVHHAVSATVAMAEQWAANERGASAIAGVRVSRAAWSAGASADFARAHDPEGFAASSFELGAELGYRIDATVPVTLVGGPRVVWLDQQLDHAPVLGSLGAVMKVTDGTRNATMLRAGGGIVTELAATQTFALSLAARAAVDVTSNVANRGTGYVTPALPEWSFELALQGEVRLWP